MGTRYVGADWYRRRWAILERDNFTCRYCGQFAPNVMLEVDHVIAVCEVGTDDDSNLVTSCTACNRGKEAFRALKRSEDSARNSLGRQQEFFGARPSASVIIYEWIVKQGRPVDKYEIIAAVPMRTRTVGYALAALYQAGKIKPSGTNGARQLWSVVAE